MSWRVPVGDVRLPADAVAAATQTLEGGWLSMGPRVEQFEREFAAFTGTEHAVACGSATAALQLALAAAGIGPGDEVVMPALTFVACANVTALAGATPVFCDIRSEADLTIDPDAVRQSIGPRTRAVIAMHYGGWPCSEELAAVARDAGVALIEDVAHAPGASGAELGPCGSWGSAGCFSFFANKNLPLGEGGMLTTSDPEVAATARALRSHGMTSGTWERHDKAAAGYDVVRPGWNLRLDEPRAAMGSALLDVLDDWNMQRARAVARYRQLLDGLDGVTMPFAPRPPGEHPAHHLAVVLLYAEIDRDAVADALAREGIQTSVHYPPVHGFSAYRDAARPLRVTDSVAPRLLTLPLFPHIADEQIELVADCLSSALQRAPRKDRSAVPVPPPS